MNDGDNLCTNLVLDNVRARVEQAVVNRFHDNDLEDLVPNIHLEQPAHIQLKEVNELDDDPVMDADLDVMIPEMVENNDLDMNIDDMSKAAIGFRERREIPEGVEVESSGAEEVDNGTPEQEEEENE